MNAIYDERFWIDEVTPVRHHGSNCRLNMVSDHEILIEALVVCDLLANNPQHGGKDITKKVLEDCLVGWIINLVILLVCCCLYFGVGADLWPPHP